MSKNETDAKPSNYCQFCLSNGESEVQYKSHTMKNTTGLVTCPVLRRYKCNICHATRDTAHTQMYCPLNKDGKYNGQGAGITKKLIRPHPGLEEDARTGFTGKVNTTAESQEVAKNKKIVNTDRISKKYNASKIVFGRLNFETNVVPLKREVAKLRAENKNLTNMLNYVETKLREQNKAENRLTTRSRDTSISSVSSLDQRSRDSIGNILQRSEIGPRISSRLSMSKSETKLREQNRAGEVKTAASRSKLAWSSCSNSKPVYIFFRKEILKHATEINRFQDLWEDNHRSIQEAVQQQCQSFIPKPPPPLSSEDLDSSVEILEIEEHANVDKLLKS